MGSLSPLNLSSAAVTTAFCYGVAAGLLLSGIVAHVPVLRRLVTPKACAPGQEKRVFVLLVSMRLNPAMGGLKTFKEAWGPLAADVKKREPNCLSYELCSGEEDENSIIIYERYVAKVDLTSTHNEGVIFKAFGKKLGEGELKGLVLEKSKSTFYETNVGFMSRVF